MVRENHPARISVVVILGTGSGNRIKELEKALIVALESATRNDAYFGHWIAKTLHDPQKKKSRLEKNDKEIIANKLKDLGQEFELDGDHHTARSYFSSAGKWFQESGQPAKRLDMQIATAECRVQEAEQIMSRARPSALVAIDSYDNAIQAYREIPNAERGQKMIDQRIAELRQLHVDASQKAPGEMKTIRTSEIDISEAILESKRLVSGKEPLEALKCFANLLQINARSLRKDSIENLREHPLIALAHLTTMTQDGRVAGKNPGIRLNQSQGGMCICLRREIVLGIWQECFDP